MKTSIKLSQLAHGRAGEKGDILNISVIAWSLYDFDHLVEHVTEAHCQRVFTTRPISQVTRYLLPRLGAMNFVIEGALDGGVNRSLYLDRHGKTLSSLLFDSTIPAPKKPRGGSARRNSEIQHSCFRIAPRRETVPTYRLRRAGHDCTLGLLA